MRMLVCLHGLGAGGSDGDTILTRHQSVGSFQVRCNGSFLTRPSDPIYLHLFGIVHQAVPLVMPQRPWASSQHLPQAVASAELHASSLYNDFT